MTTFWTLVGVGMFLGLMLYLRHSSGDFVNSMTRSS